jgi:hypothetical protein
VDRKSLEGITIWHTSGAARGILRCASLAIAAMRNLMLTTIASTCKFAKTQILPSDEEESKKSIPMRKGENQPFKAIAKEGRNEEG